MADKPDQARPSRNLRLAATPGAPEQARSWLKALAEPLINGRLPAAQLMVSELVTNSLRHARLGREDGIDVTVSTSGQRVRVTVGDPGPGFQAPLEPALPPMAAPDGRGLFIVSRMADRWGVEAGGESRVWFELHG